MHSGPHTRGVWLVGSMTALSGGGDDQAAAPTISSDLRGTAGSRKRGNKGCEPLALQEVMSFLTGLTRPGIPTHRKSTQTHTHTHVHHEEGHC